jgi:hypothetical protein
MKPRILTHQHKCEGETLSGATRTVLEQESHDLMGAAFEVYNELV